MASSSFFIQRPEDALRHLNLLAKGLKRVAIAGLVGGAACSVLAVFLGRFLITPDHETSGMTLVTRWVAMALFVYSGLYLLVSWGLSHQKGWSRYTAAAVFVSKVLLCAWFGRSSLGAMAFFLLVAMCDIYGLWVLLSKETAQLFTSPETSQAAVKPVDLAT